ncbi:helix-turn-helix domain-containing protein [Mesorhizobium sp. M4A.F.Ca.ET.020.02.1.1]|uniref:helix-turn-helix domain-containing protein n=1 Tax=Mesorhizobium sp. M4A.F.Ca.ET.020.02.1.1 TaxID=2496652 RepID=UPI001678DD74|nr:helix-turn-helix domain-containing protein [Mesorhizobium sp. M4A.F.Ca.ET.020.02.1.1]
MTRHEVFPQGARDRIEILEEENRQLRATIAKLVGGDDTETARLTLSLTEAEATIFTLLVRCGVATYGQIQSAIYDVDRLDMINDVGEAIRSHVKRIRKKLRPLGIDFTTIYSLGFEMDEACRARARLMLARAA